VKKYLLLLLIPVVVFAQWGGGPWGGDNWTSKWTPVLNKSVAGRSPLLLLEAKYGGTVSTDASGVTDWLDRTTQDNDFSQGTDAKKPDYLNGDQIYYDGTDDFLTSSLDIVGQTPMTFYFKCGSTDLGAINTVAASGAWGSNNEGIEFWINTDGTITIRVSPDIGTVYSFTSAASYFTGSNVMNFGFRWSGISGEAGGLLVNGVEVETVTPNRDWAGASIQSLELGADVGGTLRFFEGPMYSVYYDTVSISNSQLSQLDIYFGD
jgi:hypothetical protein